MRGHRARYAAGPNGVSARTADGVTLRGLHLTGGRDADGHAFVVAHGMTNATGRPGTRAVLDRLATHAPVVALDFRGHGRSAGRSSVGRDEILDVDAALDLARRLGHQRLTLVGFSLGAAVALRHAGRARTDPTLTAQADAVVAVSPPARWFLRESRSMLRVQWLLEHPIGPLLAPRLGIRLAAPWDTVPSTPLAEIGRIAPTPLLLVHGTADHYFGPEQSERLHRAAPGSQLWLVDGMRHAESGIAPATVDRIAAWTAQRAAPEVPTFS